jgi:hypothetical protein
LSLSEALVVKLILREDSSKLDSENFKDITMDNQQETKNYLIYNLVGSSETTREH